LTTLFVIEPAKTPTPASASASPATELAVTLLPLTRVFVTVPPHSPAPESPAALPPELPSADTATLLFVIASLLRARSLLSMWTPPKKASASPSVLVMWPALPETVVLRIEPLEDSPMWMPPATAWVLTLLGHPAFNVALLFVTVLLFIVRFPPTRKIPPE